VTERIRLATTILIVPYRFNGALVAKQAATLDHLSNGRLVFGVAVGGREDDYEASRVDIHTRGRLFDRMLDEWQRVWAGEGLDGAGPIGPRSRPTLIIGGAVDTAYERAARYGDGWIMGGGAPDRLADATAKVKEAWKAAGREGEPLIMALAYFALGDRAQEAADGYLRHYYRWLGDDVAGAIASSAATDADSVRQYAQGFDANGCDELVFMPCDPDPAQVDLLADCFGDEFREPAGS
jgi:alkanesulfonate monooxygenase SsuD/methylene tetrahydromethanopterin reductase-like flavin-dependent oxidoreductase (luciferase family)